MKTAILGICVAAALACSCLRPIPSPPMAPGSDAGQCAHGIGPTSPDDACDGRFTASGLACVLCPVDAGCLATSVQVWCVHYCDDPACGIGKHR